MLNGHEPSASDIDVTPAGGAPLYLRFTPDRDATRSYFLALDEACVRVLLTEFRAAQKPVSNQTRGSSVTRPSRLVKIPVLGREMLRLFESDTPPTGRDSISGVLQGRLPPDTVTSQKDLCLAYDPDKPCGVVHLKVTGGGYLGSPGHSLARNHISRVCEGMLLAAAPADFSNVVEWYAAGYAQGCLFALESGIEVLGPGESCRFVPIADRISLDDIRVFLNSADQSVRARARLLFRHLVGQTAQGQAGCRECPL